MCISRSSGPCAAEHRRQRSCRGSSSISSLSSTSLVGPHFRIPKLIQEPKRGGGFGQNAWESGPDEPAQEDYLAQDVQLFGWLYSPTVMDIGSPWSRFCLGLQGPTNQSISALRHHYPCFQDRREPPRGLRLHSARFLQVVASTGLPVP